MPVEITLPLTKLEQAVADARRHQQVMEAKVEDAKLTLKAAKTAWEESVGALNLAVDEMIRDKRQPSIPFDEAGDDDGKASGEGGGEPTPGPVPPAPPAGGGGEPGTATVQEVTVEIIPNTRAISPNSLAALAALPAGPKWRALPTTELEAPEAIFAALDAFGVYTLGSLADALKEGRTFNLKLVDVLELQEAIEDVSQEDEEPVKFDRDVKVTVKENGGGDSDVLSNLFAEEPESEAAFEARMEAMHEAAAPEPEPAKPAKKSRGGRKPKATATTVTESGEVTEVEPVEPETVDRKATDFDGL